MYSGCTFAFPAHSASSSTSILGLTEHIFYLPGTEHYTLLVYHILKDNPQFIQDVNPKLVPQLGVQEALSELFQAEGF